MTHSDPLGTLARRGGRYSQRTDRKTKIAYREGWQRERQLNLDSYMTNSPKEGQVNMVADGWTEMPSYSALIGSPGRGPMVPNPEKIAEHVGKMYQLDLPLSERLRARIESIVKDPETAAKLKAWYPTW